MLRASTLWVAALTPAALAVRLHRLAGPVLRWDEGWSLARAIRPWPQLWQVAGKGAWSLRFLALARAGWYENLRQPRAAPWSYAMRWDPIIEPMGRIAFRIRGDALAHRRFWFVLYKGDFGPNAPLVEWLDANLYPAGGEWQGEMLYLAYVYVAPGDSWTGAARDERFEQGISLTGARWTPQALGGDAFALVLTWQAERRVDRSYKVFVHALDDAGQLVAQHDGIPGAGRRPTGSWQAGVEVTDRHGLLLPASGTTRSPLHIRVGLYDPETGQRLRLESGGDAVELLTLATEQAKR